MNIKLLAAIAAGLLAPSFAVHAEAPKPDYSSISVAYHNLRTSGDTELQFKGPGVSIEHSFAADLFLYGSYREGRDTIGDTRFTLKNWQAGLGTFYELNRTSTLDVLLLAGADKVLGQSEEFFAVQGGYRQRVTEFVEAGAFYRHYNYNESGSDNSFGAYVRYHTDQQVTFDLRYQTHEYGNLIQAGISYKF